MALFYDRDFGRGWHRSYDRGYRGHSGWSGMEGGYGYGGRGENRGYDRGYRGEIGRWSPFRGNRYDAGYLSRWQTGYDRAFNDRGLQRRPNPDRWGIDYDRDYSANPAGYDPYYEGRYNRGRWGGGGGAGRYDEWY